MPQVGQTHQSTSLHDVCLPGAEFADPALTSVHPSGWEVCLISETKPRQLFGDVRFADRPELYGYSFSGARLRVQRAIL